jgi:hypothetical protein
VDPLTPYSTRNGDKLSPPQSESVRWNFFVWNFNYLDVSVSMNIIAMPFPACARARGCACVSVCQAVSVIFVGVWVCKGTISARHITYCCEMRCVMLHKTCFKLLPKYKISCTIKFVKSFNQTWFTFSFIGLFLRCAYSKTPRQYSAKIFLISEHFMTGQCTISSSGPRTTASFTST